MSLVYGEHHYIASSGTYTPATPPTAGNLLVLIAHTRSATDKLLSITGWTIVESALASNPPTAGSGLSMFYRVAQIGDVSWFLATSQCEISYSEHGGGFTTLVDSASHVVDPGTSPYPIDCGGPVAPGAVASVLLVGGVSMVLDNDTDSFVGTPGVDVTELDDWNTVPSFNGSPGRWSGYRVIVAPGGAYTLAATGAVGATTNAYAGVTAAFGSGAAPEPTIDVEVCGPDGTSCVIFDNALAKKVRVERNGTGTGAFVINRYDSQATAANLRQGNIVKVTFPQIDPDPLFEFILEEGDFTLVDSDEEGGEDLSFGGRGRLAALAYTRLGHQWLDHAHPKLNFPTEGVWRWTSEEAAGIIRRLIGESQLHTPPALTGLTRDWSDTTDSDGNPFFDMDGDWEIPIGTDLLTAAMDLARGGMIQLEMRPGLLLRAYDEQGVDRTGAFGTGVVRFEKGVNIATSGLTRQMHGRDFGSSVLIHTKDGYLWFPATIGGAITGNAGTDVITTATAHGLAVNDPIEFIALTGGAGLALNTRYYVQNVGSPTTFKVSATLGGAAFNFTTNITAARITESPYVKELYLDLSNTTGTNSQERAAARRLLRGAEETEGILLEVTPTGPDGLADEAAGFYYPGFEGTANGKYWLGDLVTLHTGSDPDTDFVDATFRIHAITLYEDETGDLAPPLVELNAQFTAAETTGVSPGSNREGGSGGGSSSPTNVPHVHTQYQLGPHVATVDPTVTDDEDDDYIIGSRWLNTVDDQEWVALDVTAGAAVWVETSGAAATDLDALTDVVITSPTADQAIRYDGTNWVNTSSIWRPVMDGAGNVITDGGTGEAVMALSI